MGMTIDEAILYMSLYKQRLETSVSDGLEEDIEAYDMAIDTMRKFQQIVAIHKKYNDTQYEHIGMYEIGKVIKDGNVI